MSTFEQILDMDEEEDKEFSKGIVDGFLEQAEQTFDKMDVSVYESPLAQESHMTDNNLADTFLGGGGGWRSPT